MDSRFQPPQARLDPSLSDDLSAWRQRAAWLMLPVFLVGYYALSREGHDLASRFIVHPIAARGHMWRNGFAFGLGWAAADVILAMLTSRLLVRAYGRRATLVALAAAAPCTLAMFLDIDRPTSFASTAQAIISVVLWFNVATSAAPLICLTERLRRRMSRG